MGRTPEPRWWAARKGYFAIVGGKRHPLARGRENKAEAWRALRQILAEQDGGGVVRSDRIGLHAFLDHFFGWLTRERAPGTVQWYRGHLEPFAGFVGDVRLADLRPKHVLAWVEKEGAGWSDSTRRGAITAVKAAASWGAKTGHLAENPLRNLERPRMGRRRAVAPEAVPAILESAGDRPFADLLTALLESGARPGEVYKVTAADIDFAAGTWTLRGKTTSTTGRMRVIHMTPTLADVCRRLCAANPEGPVFRNADGNAWTSNAVRCRFRRRRETLGKVQAYGIRHLYGTDALATLPPAVAAELMGHSDLKMLQEHYGHLDERSEALRQAASAVRPNAAGNASGAPPTPAPPGSAATGDSS